ncbi:hypothetical protein BJ508DRAFT_414153, partial [Ascobolus immersus RN42]
MVAHGGYTFSVKTPTGRLKEYPYDENEPADTKTVYVEVPPENEPQTFVIDIEPAPGMPAYGSKFALIVDGCRSAVDQPLKRRYQKRTIAGLYVKQPGTAVSSLRKVSFCSIQRTEDNEIDDSMEERAKTFGTISVKIKDYESRVEYPSIPDQSAYPGPREGGKVHEKQLKGSSVSHAVKLGAETGEVHHPKATKGRVLPGAKVVRFLYRSRASLQSLGVIPSTQEPPIAAIKSPPPPTARRVKRERSESLSEITEQIKELTERAERLKAQRGLLTGEGRKVKVEEQVAPVKVEPAGRVKKEKKPIEVVDLTL